MSLDRSTVVRGPAVINYNSQTFYTKGDVKVTVKPKKFAVMVADEEIERRFDDAEITIAFIPQCAWSSGIIGVLYPYQNPTIGQLLVGGTDIPLIVHGRDGRKLTFACAAITKMPGLVLKSTDTLFKEMEFRALPANSTARTTTAAVWAEASETFTFPALSRTALLTMPYGLSWGVTSPWDSINTEDGVEIDFDMAIEEKKDNSIGVYALLLKSLTVTAKFKPLGVTAAQIMALFSPEVARGSALISANNLVITGGSGLPQVTLYSATPEEDHNLVWHTLNERVDSVMFRTARPITSGALSAIFNMAVAA